MVDVAKASKDEELVKFLHHIQTYSSVRGSVSVSDLEDVLITLPRLSFHETSPLPLSPPAPVDINSNIPTTENLEGDTNNDEHPPPLVSSPTSSIKEIQMPKSSSNADEEAARVMFVESPVKIHIRRKCHDDAWERLQSMVEMEGTDAEPTILQKGRGQTLLCVIDSKWFRCAVKSMQDSVLKVKLIDVGKLVEVSPMNIREISRKLKSQESLVECVKLNLEHPGSTWPASSLDSLREFLPEGEEVRIKEMEDGFKDLWKAVVKAEDPFDPHIVSSRSVRSFLLESGLALKRGTHQRFSSRLSANLG